MATELAKAYVQIIPSAEGIKGKLTNVLGKEAGGAGNSAGKSLGNNLVSSIKGIIAAAGIGQALKSALTEGANLQQSIGGIETLFKDSADTVIANAEKAYMTAGMSANEYMESVTSFSASLLGSLSGDTEKAALAADIALQDMSDNANKMGTSMELIQNAYQGFAKQNYTMLDNLKLGYGGTKTEMLRLLEDANRINAAQGKMTDYSIDNLADVYDAIHVIQQEMGIYGATASEAASTFSGSLASMQAAAKNVIGKLALGESVGPALNSLGQTFFTFIKDNLMPMVGNILTSLPEVLSGAFSIALQGLNLLQNNAGTIIAMGIEIVTGLSESIITALPYLAEAAIGIVFELWNTFINTDWLSVATDLISRLKDSLSLASSEILGTDTNIVESLIDGISSGLSYFIETAGQIVNSLAGYLMENYPIIMETGVNLILRLVEGIISNLPQIVSSAISVVGDFTSTLLQNAPKILETGITLLGELTAGIISAVPELIAQLPAIIEQIKEKFTSIDWGSVGRDIISGIANGIANGVSSIISAAKEAARSALNAAKELLGIKSPSRVFENEVGKMIDIGLAEGIDNNIDAVAKSMKTLSRATVGMINTDLSYSALKTSYGEEYTKSNTVGREELKSIIRNELSSIVIMMNGREFGRAVRSVN